MFARSLKPTRYPDSMTAIRSRSPIQNGKRTLFIGNGIDLVSSRLPQDPKDQEGVELLLSIATIVSREIANSDKEIFDDENGGDYAEASIIHNQALTSGVTDFPSSFHTDGEFAWHRVRAVSIDNDSIEKAKRSESTKSISLPAVVTPVGSRRRTLRKPSLKITAHRGKKDEIKLPKMALQQIQSQNLPNIMSQHKRKAIEQCAIKGNSITIIHRKKFSWKNYPGEYY